MNRVVGPQALARKGAAASQDESIEKPSVRTNPAFLCVDSFIGFSGKCFRAVCACDSKVKVFLGIATAPQERETQQQLHDELSSFLWFVGLLCFSFLFTSAGMARP